MKKNEIIGLLVFILLLLTGGAIDIVVNLPPTSNPSESAVESATTAQNEITEPVTENITFEINPTETETKPITAEPITEETESSSRNSIIAEYISAIQTKIEYINTKSSDNLTLVYTLYDMDKNEIPELLIKYGTSEDDFLIAIYTYKDGELKEICDNVAGGHTYFAHDFNSEQFVLAKEHINYAAMEWYDLNENGEFRYLSNKEIPFSDDDDSTFEECIERYDVKLLENSVFSQSNNEKITWLYYFVNDEIKTDDFYGFDYTFLENYPF